MARRSPNSSRPVRPSSTPARRKGIPLSPLAQQMLQDMQLAGLAERTHESYLRAVRKFAQWLNKSPHLASENDLRRYLLFIKNDQQWEGNSLKVAYSGLKFFYSRTCPQQWPTLSKLRVPKQVKLPTVLTIPEVDQLIDAIRKPGPEVLLLDRLFPRTPLAGGTSSASLRHRRRADVGSRPTRQGTQGPPRATGHQDAPHAPRQIGRAHV